MLQRKGLGVAGAQQPLRCVAGGTLLLGAVILTPFPLRGDYLAQMQADVLALHARKRTELEQQTG